LNVMNNIYYLNYGYIPSCQKKSKLKNDKFAKSTKIL
jgi:hypothetical protein